MVVALIVLLALGLLGAIVLGLHRFQKREAENNADRQSPLPPLDVNSVSPLSESDNDTADKNLLSPAARSVKPAVQLADTTMSPAPEEQEDTARSAANWQQACMQLRSAGHYEEALQICQQHFPQWGAFSQAATVLRASIRATHKLNKDIEPLLHELYKLAAHASFLHDKLTDIPSLTPKQLRLLPRNAWENLDMPYHSIGYNKLRLLSRTDGKMMSDLWGKPAKHVSAREFHRDAWQGLLQIVASPYSAERQ